MREWVLALGIVLGAVDGIKFAKAQVVLDRPTVIYDYSGSRFTVIEVRRMAPERYEVILRYDGRTTGTQYYRNHVDCGRDRVMSVRDGDTLEEARQARSTALVAPTWDRLVEGSSKWRTARLVCNGQTRFQ